MIAELFAVSAAFFFGLSGIFSQKGLKTSDPISGAALSVLFETLIFLIPTVLFIPLELLVSQVSMFFVVSGFLSAFLGAQLEFYAIDRTGVPTAFSIMSISPLFTVLAAVTFLQEQLTAAVGIGTIFVIAGVILISLKTGESWKWRKIGIAAALLAAVANGASVIPRKIALNTVNLPLLGTMVEMSTGLFFFGIYLALSKKKLAFDRKSLSFFSMRGLCTAAAILLLLLALSLGEAIVVSPLSNTSQLFTLFLSLLFLKKVQKITWKIVFATLLIVIGSTLIIVY